VDIRVVQRDGGVRIVSLQDGALILAGFAGRDQEEVRRHVAELAREGVPTPHATPELYRVPWSLLTLPRQDLPVPHSETSGEAEPVLLLVGGERYVTVGSDHTDRRRERTSIAWAKAFGPKVVAPEAWVFEDVADHWDEMRLEAWVGEGQSRRRYQAGELRELLPPSAFPLEELADGHEALVFFLGTLPTLSGSLSCAEHFTATLTDPCLGRALSLSYRVRPPSET